jgi:molybdopterin converting factor small subunit
MIIKYFSWIKNITKKDSEVIDNNNIKDLESLKKYLCEKYPKLYNHIFEDDVIRFAINLEYQIENHELNPIDEIALFPQVSGG